jgi:hypothetical protein
MWRRPTEGAPGDVTVVEACDQARNVVAICDALGFEFRGAEKLIGLLEGAKRSGVPLAAMIEDPNVRPYVWDLPSEEQ